METEAPKVEKPPPYNYMRDKIKGGGWDIDNPQRKDSKGNRLPLSKEIEKAFPGKHFVVRCIYNLVRINFYAPLDSKEVLELNKIVFAHRNNKKWTPAKPPTRKPSKPRRKRVK